MPTALAQPHYEPYYEYPVYTDPAENANSGAEGRPVRPSGAARRAAARARLRARTHRPFQVSVWGWIAVSLIVFQLLLLLWLTGGALYASHEEREIAKKINATREDIYRTNERISNVNSTLEIEGMASAAGMRHAQESDIDNFADKSHWNPAEVTPPASAPDPYAVPASSAPTASAPVMAPATNNAATRVKPATTDASPLPRPAAGPELVPADGEKAPETGDKAEPVRGAVAGHQKEANRLAVDSRAAHGRRAVRREDDLGSLPDTAAAENSDEAANGAADRSDATDRMNAADRGSTARADDAPLTSSHHKFHHARNRDSEAPARDAR